MVGERVTNGGTAGTPQPGERSHVSSGRHVTTRRCERVALPFPSSQARPHRGRHGRQLPTEGEDVELLPSSVLRLPWSAMVVREEDSLGARGPDAPWAPEQGKGVACRPGERGLRSATASPYWFLSVTLRPTELLRSRAGGGRLSP